MIRRATTDDVEEILAVIEPSFALLDFLPQLQTHELGLVLRPWGHLFAEAEHAERTRDRLETAFGKMLG